jgi:hypothetical protein
VRRFIAIFDGNYERRKETQHNKLSGAQRQAKRNGCECDWSGRDSRTPSITGYGLKEIYHKDGEPTWTWIFERE